MIVNKMKIDRALFQKKSLIPLLALVGLGSDGLSSSCYGPQEAYLAIQQYPYLILYVALLSVLTIFILSVSYTQIIELFPHGGGGYVVASKLFSPVAGLTAGCALLIDYILTITISIASGVDAVFSMIPLEHQHFKLEVKVICVVLLTLINLRGIRESVLPWVPIFALFCLTHLFAFGWAFVNHGDSFAHVGQATLQNTHDSIATLGTFGFLFLLFHSFSMGAGTFTGIEAVSNGMNLIREPRVPNAKKTMYYIALSLSVAVLGLVISFLLYGAVKPEAGQTINAVLFGKVGEEMGSSFFQPITLFSEMALLFVAAETGFLGGPQVLCNMALDRWFPYKFVSLSDQFVMRHGVLLMGISAAIIMLYTHGSVDILVILYSLSVFITFTLSQLGMVMHWVKERKQEKKWRRKLFINSVGLVLTFFILVMLMVFKFEQGAWLTLLVVGLLVMMGMGIRSYYENFAHRVGKIHRILPKNPEIVQEPVDRETPTAAIFIGGVNGMAIHTIANVLQVFGHNFKHYILINVGLIDAGNFKGEEELDHLYVHVLKDAETLTQMMIEKGYSAESSVAIGIDMLEEVEKLAESIKHKHHHCVFFGGHVVLQKETSLSRFLHNQTLYAIQRRFFDIQYPFITIPVYFRAKDEIISRFKI